ncbi:MAG: oxygen-independent coproporphyrinogen-3 oxidase [Polaribacter sp.]|jgi:oxygen-independent coproporphyrinogen-3 oxidase
MSGLYLHIPFCKKACHYCNFHFSTSVKNKGAMVNAIIEEIKLHKDYLEDKTLNSIYFGGGTPSLLSEMELNSIFETIHKVYTVAEDAEITLEANPDDLNEEQLTVLRKSNVNRLSIGVQSFHEADLLFMNRAHNSKEALHCIKAAQDAGFPNLTIDLIYGVPGMTNDLWKKNLEIFQGLDVPHLSSYCLTVEEGTALHHFVEKGKAPPVDEQRAAQQFELLMDFAEQQNYLHYEISNFAKVGHIAKHNTAYWQGTPYLGLGPSAHSYNRTSRQWNVANNAKYMKAIGGGRLPFEKEELDTTNQYNEYLLTRLRTQWGVELKDLEKIAPEYVNGFSEKIVNLEQEGLVIKQENTWVLTRAGKLLADRISMELME